MLGAGDTIEYVFGSAAATTCSFMPPPSIFNYCPCLGQQLSQRKIIHSGRCAQEIFMLQANDFSLAPLHVKAVVTSSEQYCKMMVNFTVRPYDYINITWKEKPEKNFQFCNNTSICKINCWWYFSYIFHVQIFKTDFPIYQGNWTFKVNKTIYKLDQLTQVKIFANIENINLSYAIINDYDDVKTFTCIYRIFYKSEWDKTAKNFTTNETEIVLEDLVPYTTYTIEIQAKPNESIYWSDKLILKKRTLPSAPYAGPKSTNGSYLEITCKEKDKRCFILYWAMIAKPLRNGILEGYAIQQNGTTLAETPKIFIKINDQPQNKELWFKIRAKTNEYQYSPPTTIHIPPKAPERPRAVTVVQLNNTHFSISWALKQPQENKTVTVMSCFGEKVGSIFWCKSDMMWTKIKNENFTILKAPKATNFAASVSNSEGSSSLTLAKCLLGGGIAKTPPKPIIFKRYPYKMELQWPSFGCNELNGRPTLFQVLYAKGNDCKNGFELNIPAIGIKPETEITEIKNLKPFTNYSVCLRIHTEEGWSQISPQLKTSTLETNPSSVRNLQHYKPNGIITEYRIIYTKLGGSTYKIVSNSSNMANVSHLYPYSKYNFTVSSCNKAGCSMEPHYISAKTLTGNTAVVDLQLTLINASILIITWKPPSFLKEHVLYYKLKIIGGKKEIIKNMTDTKYNISISCQSDDTFERVNVIAVIKNESSIIYGESTISQILCPESEKLWIIVLVVIFGVALLFIILVCLINWVSKNKKKLAISANIPDVMKYNSSISTTTHSHCFLLSPPLFYFSYT
ncbi:USH2A [Acanthosepion pharaonis]|uniref:USH2A n=1 Tax=Acanthosepion pharaonis TaxID=158019 RepID=A0A812DKG3_ACAPH|nr:USH2A [Sepia pharaonis]